MIDEAARERVHTLERRLLALALFALGMLCEQHYRIWELERLVVHLRTLPGYARPAPLEEPAPLVTR